MTDLERIFVAVVKKYGDFQLAQEELDLEPSDQVTIVTDGAGTITFTYKNMVVIDG